VKTFLLGLLCALALALPARAYVTTTPAGTGGGGPTNGQTAAQVSAAILGSAIIQTNGTGTNTTLGTLTVLQGSVKNFYFANGSLLRSNTAPPFDWEFDNTNGNRTFGTNTVTKQTFFKNGDITLPQSGGGTIVGQTLNFSQNALIGGNILLSGAIPEAGKTNLITVDSSGFMQTNDFATFVASLGGGSGISAAQFTTGLAAGTNAVSATTLDASGTSKLQAVGADTLTVTNGATFRGSSSVASLNATNFFDLGATNGANQTNLAMLNVDGSFQYGVFDPLTFSWNATTRTLSSTGGATGLANPLNADMQGATHNIWNVGVYDTTNASSGVDVRFTSQLGTYGGTNIPVFGLSGGLAGAVNKPVVVQAGYFDGSGSSLTNTAAYTHEGSATNLSFNFNGTIQSFTVTNGPDVWTTWTGANGSIAIQFLTNCTIHSSTVFNKFLAGSNGVSTGVYKITNGWFTVTSAGGTNGVQLSPAIVENQ
jgi:hypothetical protein